MTSEDIKHQFIIIIIGSELRNCVKVEVDVLGSPSLIVLRSPWTQSNIELELITGSEIKSCVKVEMAVLGSRL